jgi:hypothetical protein
MVRREEPSVELTIEDVAGRAGVDAAYVRRLIVLGVVGPEGEGYREQDAHVTALLHMWEEAGLTAESILAATASGQLSLDFLESPGWEFPPRLDRTYRQLAEERGMPIGLLPAVQRSMGWRCGTRGVPFGGSATEGCSFSPGVATPVTLYRATLRGSQLPST